jgi:DNA-binding transcriptional ArsR family regulator
MTLELDPQLVSLFGSETRTAVLAALAGASVPFSGYRVAQVADVQPIKAYAELRRLRDAGIVRETPRKKGRSVWELPLGEIRSLVADRTRVYWSGDWINNPRRRTTPADRRFAHKVAKAATKRPSPSSIPPAARAVLSEMTRPSEKDEILERLGLATSVRRGRR